jgi:hypothetical protein
VDRIVIIGQPGTGKTTSLAYIASQLSKDIPESDSLYGYIPIYIHYSDATISSAGQDEPLLAIVDEISRRHPVLNPSRVATMLESHFNENKIILLFDGLDGTYHQEIRDAVDTIKSILNLYPGIKIVVSAAAEHISDLPTMGFYPFPIAIWGLEEQASFIQKWSTLWREYIEIPENSIDDPIIKDLLIDGWLMNHESAVFPLDFTLLLWAAYAGDSLGLRPINTFESYIRRICNFNPKSRPTLDFLARNLSLRMKGSFTDNEARKWFREEKKEIKTKGKSPKDNVNGHEISTQWDIDFGVFQELLKSGFLVQHFGDRYTFSHPMIFAYLAGSIISPDKVDSILNQQDNAMKKWVMRYLPYHPVLDNFIEKSLTGNEDPLLRDRITLCDWLPSIPQESPLRDRILTQIVSDIQNEILPTGMKYELSTAIINSGDTTLPTIFRQLINANQPSTRQLAVFMLGYLRDVQSIPEIGNMLLDTTIIGQSACFALVKIGTKPALEAVTSAMLSGNELIAFASAEAFASHQKEGHPIIKEGSSVEEILIRRAAVVGLKKINKPWALEILEDLQINDTQWIVKNAANQALLDLNQKDPSFPKYQPPLEDLPWLVAFASERGVGISSGKPAVDMLMRVLTEGNFEEIAAAIDQIKIRGFTDIFPTIYTLFFGDIPNLKNASYNLIKQVASMGVDIPSLDLIAEY